MKKKPENFQILSAPLRGAKPRSTVIRALSATPSLRARNDKRGLVERLPVWMEVKLVLSPTDYRMLKNQAQKQSRNVAEFVNQLIVLHLKAEAHSL